MWEKLIHISVMDHPVRLPPGVMKLLLCCCIICLVLGVCESSKDQNELLKSLDNIQVTDPSQLEAIRESNTLSVVYFFTSVATPSRENFLQAFDNSAMYLDAYNIALIVVNCLESPVTVDECQEVNTIATYQNGVEFIKLDIETMFDINSIMANSLQLLLLREVPIVESQSDRETLQEKLQGKQDLIFFYTRALGTLEHRVFMEIAYTYQDKYKFAVSTRLETTQGLLEEEERQQAKSKYALWTLFCSKSSQDTPGLEGCPSILYRNSLTLSALDDYVDRLSKPNLYYAPENGTRALFEMKTDIPIIFIYTNKALKQQTDEISIALSFDVKGLADIIVVDVEDEECHQLASSQGYKGPNPVVAVALPVRNGKFVFMNRKSHLHPSHISHFLSQVTASAVSAKLGAEIVNATNRVRGESGDDEVNAVEIQDDEVAKVVFKPETERLDVAHVPAVLKATFQQVILDAPLKVVLYYLPFDAVSMAFLGDFDEAAKTLGVGNNAAQDVLARVNCYDATDLCARENITTYPVIRIHKKDLPCQAYEGPLDTYAIVKAVGLLQEGFPLKLRDEEELNQFIRGDFPIRITHLTPSSVVFAARDEDKGTWHRFREASNRLSPFVAMGEVHGSLMNVITKKHRCPPPCVLSFHHRDSMQPVRALSNVSHVDGIVRFVKQAMIASVPELTESNFPILHSKEVPFVILFLNQSSPDWQEDKSEFSKIASLGNFGESAFCWMNAQSDTIGMELLKKYTQADATPTPTIAVVNHKQAEVFTHHTVTFASDDVIDWLTKVFNGLEEPSSRLDDKVWTPPGPHYDFLKMIDEDLEDMQEETLADEADSKNEEVLRDKLLHRYHTNNRGVGADNRDVDANIIGDMAVDNKGVNAEHRSVDVDTDNGVLEGHDTDNMAVENRGVDTDDGVLEGHDTDNMAVENRGVDTDDGVLEGHDTDNMAVENRGVDTDNGVLEGHDTDNMAVENRGVDTDNSKKSVKVKTGFGGSRVGDGVLKEDKEPHGHKHGEL